MTTTNYKGHKIITFRNIRNGRAWTARVSKDDKMWESVGDSEGDVLAQAFAWIDAQEGTE